MTILQAQSKTRPSGFGIKLSPKRRIKVERISHFLLFIKLFFSERLWDFRMVFLFFLSNCLIKVAYSSILFIESINFFAFVVIEKTHHCKITNTAKTMCQK